MTDQDRLSVFSHSASSVYSGSSSLLDVPSLSRRVRDMHLSQATLHAPWLVGHGSIDSIGQPPPVPTTSRASVTEESSAAPPSFRSWDARRSQFSFLTKPRIRRAHLSHFSSADSFTFPIPPLLFPEICSTTEEGAYDDDDRSSASETRSWASADVSRRETVINNSIVRPPMPDISHTMPQFAVSLSEATESNDSIVSDHVSGATVRSESDHTVGDRTSYRSTLQIPIQENVTRRRSFSMSMLEGIRFVTSSREGSMFTIGHDEALEDFPEDVNSQATFSDVSRVSEHQGNFTMWEEAPTMSLPPIPPTPSQSGFSSRSRPSITVPDDPLPPASPRPDSHDLSLPHTRVSGLSASEFSNSPKPLPGTLIHGLSLIPIIQARMNPPDHFRNLHLPPVRGEVINATRHGSKHTVYIEPVPLQPRK